MVGRLWEIQSSRMSIARWPFVKWKILSLNIAIYIFQATTLKIIGRQILKFWPNIEKLGLSSGKKFNNFFYSSEN